MSGSIELDGAPVLLGRICDAIDEEDELADDFAGNGNAEATPGGDTNASERTIELSETWDAILVGPVEGVRLGDSADIGSVMWESSFLHNLSNLFESSLSALVELDTLRCRA